MSGNTVRLFDAHCHLQDRRLYGLAGQLIRTAMDAGVRHFVVNGVSEGDWHLVRHLACEHPSVLPSFGLHPWYVRERSPNWLDTLKGFFDSTPEAAVGEIGLDKGTQGKQINFVDQVLVFEQQLELAKALERPVSVHCVRAYGDLLEIMQRIGPFSAGVILHSFLGSAEMVPVLAKLGAYFSFSGYLLSLKPQKAKKMLVSIPTDRILLESDAPDALPRLDMDSVLLVPGDPSASPESTLPEKSYNHPANIRCILSYVAELLGIPKEELAEAAYRNSIRLFSYPGSCIQSNSGDENTPEECT